MRIQLKLFALARQLADAETIAVELPPSAVVADLRHAVAQQYPPLADVLPHATFAIDAQYVHDNAPVPPDAEIACIPPVSGG
jgi:molybdopterin converting factor small subunit